MPSRTRRIVQGRWSMTERGDAVRRPARAPLARRSRKRWAVAAGATACWVVLLSMTGSTIGATLVQAVLTVLGIVSVLLLRSLGVTGDQPWIRQLAARPWRDGQDVLQLALRHLSEVFVITPSGSLLAPNLVELRLNPDDLGLIAASATEFYEEQVAAHDARFAGNGPPDVRVIADPAVPAGRYHLRPGQPVNANPEPGSEFVHPGFQPVYAGFQPARDGPYQGFMAHDGGTYAQPEADQSE